jgi:uncharacterized cupin superfamily protein
MNTLEANSIRTGKTCGETLGIDIPSKRFGANTPKVEPGSIAFNYHLI